MATLGSTRVGSIIVPDVYLSYFNEESVLRNQLIQSGIVERDPRMDALARQGGNLITLPFFQDLAGTAQVPSGGTAGQGTDVEMTVYSITTRQDQAALLKRQMAWGSEDLAYELAGSDPMKAIADMEINWWMNQEQKLLIYALRGIIAHNGASQSSSLIMDVSTASLTAYNANKASFAMQADYIIDAAAKLGDAAGKLTAIMMHSVQFKRLQKENLIDYEQNSQQNTFFPYYLGYRVIVDDDCPRTHATHATARFTAFLFGRGAIARGEGIVKVPVEIYRKPLASLDVLIRRRAFILHPRGIKYKGTFTVTPTDANLYTSTNWSQVYDTKNIRIVALMTNA